MNCRLFATIYKKDKVIRAIVLDTEDIKAPDELRQAQALANITDTAVRIPGIGIQVGLDFLIGLIPVVGDTIMALVALRIVYLGRKMNMPKTVQRKMIRNVVIDLGLGFVPVVGDIADLVFKANKRNVRMMERYWLEQHHEDIRNYAAAQLEKWGKENA